MAKIGYARVSSVGQSLEVQIEQLKQFGCDKIFTEKRTGTTTDNRTQLKAAMDYVREGDSFVITRIDRLARSVVDLANIVDQLEKLGVAFVITEQSIDTNTPAGKALLQMLGVFAEFENTIRAERIKSGVAKAQARGVKFGRPTLITDEIKNIVLQLRTNKVTLNSIESQTGLSRSTLYKIIREAA